MLAVAALNDVLDEGLDKHPLEEQRQSVRDWRQIGLGIMGLADALIKLGITYGSPEAINFCHTVFGDLATNALHASAYLASCFEPYAKYSDVVQQSEFYQKHTSGEIEQVVSESGLYNSQLLTVAPTGTISTMIGVSGGIEPIFANSYTRTTKSLHGEDVTYKVYTPIVKKYMDKHGITDEKDLPEYFVTSADITGKDRVAMQAAIQAHIDASISSTVNLPNSATIEDVAEIYMEAWKQGLKGITVYRAGCAREGILQTEETATAAKQEDEKPWYYQMSTNGKFGLEKHLTTGCGSLHICAFFDEQGNLKNTYLSKGSSGGCNNFMIGLSRMISLAARNGTDVHEIVDQLKSSGTCPSYAVRKATKNDTSAGTSCPVAIGNALLEMWEEVNKSCDHSAIVPSDGNSDSISNCPECGEKLRFEGGCNTCPNCGWSKCN